MNSKRLQLFAGFFLVFLISAGAQADVTFATKVDYPTGTYPYSVTTGDFNGDGNLDLATANYSDNTVSILLGTGTGTFGTNTGYAVGLHPSSVTTGDFNGDGKLDLAVGNSGTNTVSILLGTGTGTFGTKTDCAVSSSPSSVTTGDFNGDGKLDLATANYADTVSILLGTGTGTFGTNSDYAVGAGPFSVITGDLNGDGKLDLATANYSDNTVSILLGTGTGSFGTKTDFAVGSYPLSVTLGDFNGDGKLDLAVANRNSDTVSILLGTGTGTFGTNSDYAVGDGPFSVTTGDFNGDGKIDLATANQASSTVSILLGTGTGIFGAKTDYAVGSNPLSVATGDFNKDGYPDLVTANKTSNNVSVLLNTVIPNAKIAAHIALATALATYTSTDYTAGNWTMLTGFKTAGDTAINAATDLAGVNSARDTAIAGMAGVVKDLLNAKVAAHAALTTALATYTSTDYTAANWTMLTGFKTAGDTAINAATDLAGVTSAQNTATTGMAGVLTIAQQINADKAALVENDIRGGNADLLHVTVALTNPLPSSGANGSAITWASGTPAVVSHDGQTIDRPAYASGDAAVTFTATLTIGASSDTKQFSMTVLKLPPSTNATLTSGTYAVSNVGGGSETITNVPLATSKASFLAALSKSESHQNWNDAGIANPVMTGNTLVVTAQDGTTAITYTVTVNSPVITASAGSNGSISPVGTVTLAYNGSLTFTITPDANYHVADVLVDSSSVGTPTSYPFTNVTANHTISVTFAIDTYSIMASAGPNGSITLSATVDYGAGKTFMISPATGYHVADVIVDSVPQGAIASYTFTNVTANHTISARFARDAGDCSISGTAGGAIQQGVTLMLSGPASSKTTSGADGTFTFEGLSDGSYIVTPRLSGYTFNPSSRKIPVSGENIAGCDFTATKNPGPYSISGIVSGDVQAGITITLSGALSSTTLSGADGSYSFTGLADGNYTVAPELSGYSFTPFSQDVTRACSKRSS